MLVEPRSARDRLWRVASSQRGYFTAAQALHEGYSYQAQRFHAQRGNWIRIDRGIYRFREFLDLGTSDTDSLVRWSLWSKGRAVVSHLTALAVHDLGVANPQAVHLTVPSGFRQADPVVILHRDLLEEDDIVQREGFRVTAPLRAVAESAAISADQDVIDSAVSDLLARGEATRRQILHAAQRLGPQASLSVERALRESPS
ncbi:type IV toxin-antitoxin system AbiEi family antitoxin domain-containing protein [Microbispora bryophytorum]|uniref:type IV toxin-antitoxin system AbiEi family antitoxin domain-containing protein n=1 Tax=Microbispora bryophytorum TaxID=1460882 RepID=UPI0033EEA74A